MMPQSDEWKWDDLSSLGYENWHGNESERFRKENYAVMNCVVFDFCNKTDGEWYNFIDNGYYSTFPVCKR